MIFIYILLSDIRKFLELSYHICDDLKVERILKLHIGIPDRNTNLLSCFFIQYDSKLMNRNLLSYVQLWTFIRSKYMKAKKKYGEIGEQYETKNYPVYWKWLGTGIYNHKIGNYVGSIDKWKIYFPSSLDIVSKFIADTVKLTIALHCTHLYFYESLMNPHFPNYYSEKISMLFSDDTDT